MGHSLDRRPIDICRHRGEEKVIIGNAGVVRVIELGPDTHQLRPGDFALVFSSSVVDRHGYPEKMLGYDAPGTMGCLATRIRIRERELVSLPRDTRYDLAQWAAFSVRYITAWSNWELAYGTFRLMVPETEQPCPNVWGWGGGTTLAELELAQRHHCRAVMVSGSDANLQAIERAGLTSVDRRSFGDLSFDEARFRSDLHHRKTYVEAERAFLAEVERRTNGEGVQIFVEYIGSPVFRASLRALGRNGVITTAGWKNGMEVSYVRASECIARHQLIHTHYASRRQAVAAVEYAERTGWMPVHDPRIYSFREIPELAKHYAAGETGMFPVFAVNSI
jgi:NADPH:quinone reductase-like Zn-dependent oxidoreductase